MPVYFARWDWMLVFIVTFIIRRTTPARYVPMLKRTRKIKKKQSKRAQRKDQEDNYKLVKWSVYSAGTRFETI